MAVERLCKNCQTAFLQFNTLQKHCGKCSYNLLSKKPPIRKMGKQAKKWVETRHEWIKANPAPWECYLKTTPLCPRRLDIDNLTLDHVVPKGSHVEGRYDLNNLKPCCIFCNSDKGSRPLDNYLKDKV